MSLEKITQGAEQTKSLDLVNENIQKLKELFPEVLAEGKIDFKVLQEILGEEIEEGEEYYRFTWAGKAQARREAHKPSTGTLRPCKEESVDWDTTQNLYIEGDNLEVLKLMQKSYANKVKMIYIDPPYNTGKDFVYKDNYKDNLKNYQQVTGQIDDEGNKLSTNSESDGRYHSNWLNMMYPRLRLARNLLKEDGVIFISIDDNEVDNLRKLCDEIFGSENFVNSIAVKMSEASGVKMNHQNVRFPKIKEYLLFYKKSFFKGFIEIDKYKQDVWDNENNIFLENFTKEDRDKLIKYEEKSERSIEDLIEINNTLKKIKKRSLSEIVKTIGLEKEKFENWKFENAYRIIKTAGSSSLANLVREIDNKENEIAAVQSSEGTLFYYITDFNRETKTPRLQVIFADSNIYKNPCDFWQDIKTTGAIANEGGVKYTNGKKPLKLLQRIVKMTTSNDDIIVDFFSGSASTGHAVWVQNNLDNMNRRFILIQLNEDLENSLKEAVGDSKKTIQETIEYLKSIQKPLVLSELGKERLRISRNQLIDENKDLGNLGFRVFKLDSSNIKGWDGNPEDLETSLFDAQENIKADRTEEDVLFEIILKYGLDLTLPIEEKVMEGKKVFNVGFGALFICLADGITNKVAEGIGAWKQELNPATCRVIFKDSGFTDVEKANAVQTLKRFGINEVKSI